MARAPFGFTVCKVAEQGRIAAKRITRLADGSLSKSNYDNVTWWRFIPADAASLEAMADALRSLALKPERMLVMGEPVNGLNLRLPHRRLWADPAIATLHAVERAWAALDIDDVVVPDDMGKPGRLRDGFLAIIRTATGLPVAGLRKIWNRRAVAAAERRALTAEEIATIGAVKRADERKQLWPQAEAMAMTPDILADAVETAHLAGVVGEDGAIKASYLAMTSRILAEERTLSVLRTGQSSGGKSYATEKVVVTAPPECVVTITGGSPKSLVYMVVDDREALRHKVVVLGETAGFIGKSDVEDNPAATLVRELLTRGRADYHYVERGDDGMLTSKHLEAEGPIALITTSAREDLDPEMRNRFVAIPANESPKATRAIQKAQILGEAEKTSAEARRRAAKHRALQSWLQTLAPVRVILPDDLRRAIFAASCGMPDTVQTRRDVQFFLLAVKTSAALYMAQRPKDREGRVVASFDDYRHAHDSFDMFLAREYSVEIKPEEILVLAAIEALIAEDQEARAAQERAWTAAGAAFPLDHVLADQPTADFGYDKIQARLNMKSRNTLTRRIKALKAAGALTVEWGGVGQPATWKLLVSPAQARSGRCGQFMPTPSAVAIYLGDATGRESKVAELAAAAERLPDWAEGAAQNGPQEPPADGGEGDEEGCPF
jgi:hypothetical protein